MSSLLLIYHSSLAAWPLNSSAPIRLFAARDARGCRLPGAEPRCKGFMHRSPILSVLGNGVAATKGFSETQERQGHQESRDYVPAFDRSHRKNMSRLVATKPRSTPHQKRRSTPRPAVLETRFLLLGPPADGLPSNGLCAWLLISLPDSFLYLAAHDPISRERSESTRNRGKLKTLNRRWGVWDVNATHLVGESPILPNSRKLNFRL